MSIGLDVSVIIRVDYVTLFVSIGYVLEYFIAIPKADGNSCLFNVVVFQQYFN